MLNNNSAYTTTEMQWPNLFNTYQFLKRTDATTADEKIISYLDQQVQKAVESGFATEAELKKRLRTNLVADYERGNNQRFRRWWKNAYNI